MMEHMQVPVLVNICPVPLKKVLAYAQSLTALPEYIPLSYGDISLLQHDLILSAERFYCRFAKKKRGTLKHRENFPLSMHFIDPRKTD